MSASSVSASSAAASGAAPTLDDLLARLPGLMALDRQRLGRRLEGTRKIRKPEARTAVYREIAEEFEAAEARVAERRSAVPAIDYPQALPVSRKKDEILAAIRDHQVVIVAGETGSGKTTQLPKICLELGRGVTGLIGHTQPRRIAARTVAERIAEELRTPLGGAVGWKVRFTDQVGDGTLVKLMTDGILLAEIQSDRELRQYDTIIVDEAHERSLNIDFILGYLAGLLPRRPDLKVVITSATIDPQRFSRHFGGAPVVEVSGRTYPVEVRYRPIQDGPADSDRDQTTAICDAVDELQAEGPGDILVFLSGEREIRDTADALSRRALRLTEVLPLYARLSHAEQHRIFQPHTGRRVVLATNVAETSLTVPGIRYVIDPGTARISRYSHRTKVQRLPIEAISQASANQRKGRCGRTADGICVRLYSEEDFLARPEFTDAEILRTNLASVILQMTAAGLGDIARFPFIDPPDSRNIKDGVQLLEELGALEAGRGDGGRRLTAMGRRLSQLPVDPRLARMVLEADRNGCLHEVMVIAAALSIQDPRERPADRQQQADASHARFRDETSDFLAFVNLWRYLRERQEELSSSAFRRMCRGEYLNYLRIREWQDIYGQLRAVVRSMGIHPGAAASGRVGEPDGAGDGGGELDPRRVHASLLAGLLSHIGVKDGEKNEYLGARGARFAVFPGSALFKKQPRWLMSAELVETSRLWARVNARIEPEWVEPLAEHLVKREYSEPHWEQRPAAVLAYERVTLYGVPIVARRKVNYGRIDPEVSRELFIRNALVEGDWRTHHRFFHDNRRLLGEVAEMEQRARRRDILVDDEALFDFYDARLPADIVSGAHFDAWWKRRAREDPDLLDFEHSMLINDSAEAVSKEDYPDTWRQGRLRFTVTYQFEPGADADGVTVHVPLQVLNQVTPDGFDWQIPGLRESLVTELIRSLPKPVRRHYVPAPNHARAFLDSVGPGAGPGLDPDGGGHGGPGGEPLTTALARELGRSGAVPVHPEDFDWSRVPDHLKPTFRVTDESGRRLAEAKDLAELKLRLRPKTREAISRAADRTGIEQRSGLTGWSVGTLPRTVEMQADGPRGGGGSDGHPVKAYPALVDEGSSVAVRLCDTEAEQAAAMWRGTRRLILLNLPTNPAKFAQDRLSNTDRLALARNPHGGVPALFEDCLTATADRLIAEHGGPAWDEAGFRALFDQVRARITDALLETVVAVRRVLAAWHACEGRLRTMTSPALLAGLADVREQLAALVPAGFVTSAGVRRLPDLHRYLVAADRRLQQMPTHAERDRLRMAKVRELREEYDALLAAFPPGRPVPEPVREIRWLLEELRVSYFAHALGTAQPVSDKRVLKAIDAAWP